MDRKTAQAILTIYMEDKKLEKIVRSSFQFNPKSRIRRGIVANAVAEQLGINKNQSFYKRLKVAMLSLGAREIRVDGKSYWGELSYHPDTIKETME